MSDHAKDADALAVSRQMYSDAPPLAWELAEAGYEFVDECRQGKAVRFNDLLRVRQRRAELAKRLNLT